jgi:hypothetical protein
VTVRGAGKRTPRRGGGEELTEVVRRLLSVIVIVVVVMVTVMIVAVVTMSVSISIPIYVSLVK